MLFLLVLFLVLNIIIYPIVKLFINPDFRIIDSIICSMFAEYVIIFILALISIGLYRPNAGFQLRPPETGKDSEEKEPN